MNLNEQVADNVQQNSTNSADATDATKNVEATNNSDESTTRQEETEEQVDYAKLSKEELVNVAVELSKSDKLAHANRVAREIKPLFQEIIDAERQEALNAFVEAGNEEDAFEYTADKATDTFFEAIKAIRKKRADEMNKQKAEKLENLKKKQYILDQIKSLVEGEETEDSLNQLKELQNQWRQIKGIPREFAEELYESYRFYLDKFYDELSINFELKELDRKKNLEKKIELCKKVDELTQESSIKKALILLNKYHEDFKNTGPVPKEYNEEIWSRFKAASDKIYEVKKEHQQELDKQREQNLELKKAICEKADIYADVTYEKPKEWINKTKELQNLFAEWKKIGQVPKAHNDEIWKRFRTAYNSFFKNKNTFFKELNNLRGDNLKLKVAICEKAEAIKESTDFAKTSNELKRLQQEWKKIGPVPDKNSDEVWKRFRAACDHFFNKMQDQFADRRKEEEENLVKKNAICDKLETLEKIDDKAEVFKQLKELQAEWMQLGHVPIKEKDKIYKRHKGILDKIYGKHKIDNENIAEGKHKEHYEMLMQMPDGENKLKFQERKLRDKIKDILSDVVTWENNIEFFANSKNADALKKDIEKKINNAHSQTDRIKKELQVLRSVLQSSNANA